MACSKAKAVHVIPVPTKGTALAGRMVSEAGGQTAQSDSGDGTDICANTPPKMYVCPTFVAMTLDIKDALLMSQQPDSERASASQWFQMFAGGCKELA